MRNLLIISSLFLYSYCNAYSQDTTRLAKSIEYFSKTDTVGILNYYGKNTYYRARYSPELIIFSLDSFKYESCFYYDNVRYARGWPVYYTIKNDSILRFENEEWIFKNPTDTSYEVYQIDNEFKTVGQVRSLVPFRRFGEFKTYNSNNEIIYTEDFSNKMRITTPQYELTDSIYTDPEKRPMFPSEYGDLKEFIAKHVRYPNMARESSIAGKVFVQFIVTKDGEIKNIKILRSVDPWMDREAIKVTTKLPRFEPAEHNGEKVNAYFQMPISFKLY